MTALGKMGDLQFTAFDPELSLDLTADIISGITSVRMVPFYYVDSSSVSAAFPLSSLCLRLRPHFFLTCPSSKELRFSLEGRRIHS